MLKVLHISFHRGCQNDIEYISKKLNFELTFMECNDGNVLGELLRYGFKGWENMPDESVEKFYKDNIEEEVR